MSLITIDDDSTSEAEGSVSSVAGDEDSDMNESSGETSDNKSTPNDNDNDTDSNEELSNSKSNDTDLLLPLQKEGADDSEPTDTAGNDDSREKPILELMKHLIHYNGRQNTTLTNAALIKMLKHEFHIDVPNLPLISVEIYMNVLKKFLKDWPQWDEFDRVMHESRCMNENNQIERMLEREYLALRGYLAAMLKACRPWVRESAQKIKRMEEIPVSAQAVPGDVILEVNCSRSQLNKLFFRKPHPDFNNTIFNVENDLPSKINISAPSLKTILNSGHIRLIINTKGFKYKRELIHDLKHKLVNKKNHQQMLKTNLNQHLQVPKALPKKEKIISKKNIKAITDKIIQSNGSLGLEVVETICQIINDDVSVIEHEIGIPAVFRHYMNPYAYVRYLYEDINTESDKYDLQLEEKLSPRLKFQISRLCFEANVENVASLWLKFECSSCELTFLGLPSVEQLKEHFRDHHQNEPDLMCTNCDKTFSVNELALTRWYHKCPKPVLFNSDTE